MPIDETAKEFLESCGGRLPLKTRGDGNCLFNAISLVLFGNEEAATELRVRTCLELVENQGWYENSYESSRIQLVCPDLIEASLAAARDGSYSSAYTMAAAASVIGTKLTSVYPPVSGMLDGSLSILNATFIPRQVTASHNAEVFVMWTSTMPKDKKFQRWNPNHFVPLVLKEQLNLKKDHCETLHKIETKKVYHDLDSISNVQSLLNDFH